MGIISLDSDSFAEVNSRGVTIYHSIQQCKNGNQNYEKLFIPFTKLEKIRSEFNRVCAYEDRQRRFKN